MHLFDTLSNSKRELLFRDPGRVSIYACGPTVYDAPHLGHARNALTYDVLRRYLEWRGFDVRHVSNITDIDDNIIQRATKEGSTEQQVAETWERSYIEAMDQLNVLHPHERPHATAFVTQMIDFITELVDKNVAYETETGVYLSIAKVPDYGALIHRTPNDLRESAKARVEKDDAKHDPLDFALWKRAKPGEPTWPSPWGEGRPGWHIECVAMSLEMLGPGFDIHGGGDDLVFPHHENERAEAIAGGYQFASYWVHHAMVNVSGEKMSKSLGNFTTIGNLLEKHDGRALRLLVLQSHYRKAMEVNTSAMAQAEAALQRLDSLGRRASNTGLTTDIPKRDEEAIATFIDAMDDDLGTPRALATVFEIVNRANSALDNGSNEAACLIATAIELADALGLSVDLSNESTVNPEIDQLVGQRDRARISGDFEVADRIRDELQTMGVEIEDTPDGPVWRFV